LQEAYERERFLAQAHRKRDERDRRHRACVGRLFVDHERQPRAGIVATGPADDRRDAAGGPLQPGGHGLRGAAGEAAISAVGIAGAIVGVLWTLCIGITTGSAALVAQAVGAGNRARAEKVAGQGLMMALVLSVGVAALTVPLAGYCVRALGAPPKAAVDAARYLRICMAGSFAMLLNASFSAALRGAGDTMTPLKITAVGFVVNIILDPILIFGLWGMPVMGVAGSATATVIARTLTTGLMAAVFFRGRHAHFHLHLRDMKPDGRTIRTMLRIGVFGSGQALIRNFSGLALIGITAAFGEVALAAYTVGMRLRMALMMPGMGFGVAASTLVGQNLGAHNPERAERAGWLVAGMYAACAIVISIVFWVFAEPVIRVFNDSPDVVSTGASFLRWFSTCFCFMAFSMVLGRAMHGAGDTLWPMLLTGFSLLVLRIPLAYLLVWRWQSVDGVWAGLTISIIIEGLLAITVFRWGRWKIIGKRHVEAAGVGPICEE